MSENKTTILETVSHSTKIQKFKALQQKYRLKSISLHLSKVFPECEMIPCNPNDKKRPMYKFQGSSYTFNDTKHIPECYEHGALLLVPKELIVVDIDDKPLSMELENMCPEFKMTPCVETSKGFHYYFRHTSECDDAMIHHGARELCYPDGEEIPIDIRSISRTGTRGVISIPSPGNTKTWIRDLESYDPIYMPSAFCDYWKKYSKKYKQKHNNMELQNAKTKMHHPPLPALTKTNIIERLLSLLSPSRYDNRDEWLHLGFCLHNINKDICLPYWIEFSKKSDKYKPGECEEIWSKAHDYGAYTIKHLHDWARRDSPDAYRLAFEDNVFARIVDEGPSHEKLADIAFDVLDKQYICSDYTGDVWYYYNGNNWEIDDGACELYSKLTTTVRDYIKYNATLFSNDGESRCSRSTYQQSGGGGGGKQNTPSDKIFTAALLLENNTYVRSVLRCLKVKCHDKDFYNSLDTNVNLISFKNGCWMLKEKEFRALTPDDRVSICIPYNYEFETCDDEMREIVIDYWNKLHPNPDQREYMLKCFARQLYGDKGNNLLHLHAGFMGQAANGKSSFFDILEKCFHKYVAKFPITYLTTKNIATADSPSPMFNEWRGVRFLYSTEPNSSDTLDSGILKELTGGEKVVYRLLYSNNRKSFTPQYKVHIMCNDPPMVHGNDCGVQRRMVKVDYISKFVSSNEVNESEHMYERDEDFIMNVTKTESFKCEFVRYLFEHYDHGFQYIPPDVVRHSSRMYLLDNDVIRQFVNDYIVEEKDSFFTLVDAKLKYEEIEDCKKNKRLDLKKELEKLLRVQCISRQKIEGVRYSSVFWGYKLLD